MTIKQLVAVGNTVNFLFYRKGELWYEVVEPVLIFNQRPSTKRLFVFPVPISDCGDGQFNAQDKAITYMRYIRKQLEEVRQEQEAINEILNSANSANNNTGV